MLRRPAAIVLLLLSIACAAVAAEPLTLKDFGKLRLEKKTPAQLVELAKERGLAFQVDKDAAAALRAMQFKADEIALLAKIADGSYAGELKKAAEDAAKAEAEKPQPPKAGTAPQGVMVGPRLSNAAHDTIANRAKRIWESSNTNTKMFPAESVTLVASEKSSKVHLPNVKKLEVELRKRFGEPTKTGTDKRSAYVVLLDNRYDYERWVKAMFQVYEKDGIKWTSPNALETALKGPAFLTPTMTVCDLSALTPEQQQHQPVFCVGYLYESQLMEGRSPDAVVNGFGNVCEVILFGMPTIRVNDPYGGRELGMQAAPWAQVVRERLQKKELGTIDKVLRYTFVAMDSPQYCEAWSLTAFLAETPDLFNRWITAVRDKEKPLEAMLRVFGKSEEELTKEWHKFIQKQK
jgi:hypothetical protein